MERACWIPRRMVVMGEGLKPVREEPKALFLVGTTYKWEVKPRG